MSLSSADDPLIITDGTHDKRRLPIAAMGRRRFQEFAYLSAPVRANEWLAGLKRGARGISGRSVLPHGYA